MKAPLQCSGEGHATVEESQTCLIARVKAENERLRVALHLILASQFVPAAGQQRNGWKYGTLKLTRLVYDTARAALAATKG
jgi:hypothetical protein